MRDGCLKGNPTYIQLLAERFSEGLLKSFNCFICGEASLDPVESYGFSKFICAACSDASDRAELTRAEHTKDRDQINALLLGRIDLLARHLFPQGRKVGNSWRVGILD